MTAIEAIGTRTVAPPWSALARLVDVHHREASRSPQRNARRVTRGLDPRVHLFRNKFVAKKMDCRVKCSVRTDHRRVFGDMTDTSSLHGFGSKGAIHAVARGVDHGAAA
jgi:hypothetical protein